MNRCRPAVDCRIEPGKASDFIHHLPDLLAKEKKPVALYCRVSSQKQEQDGNLKDQVDDAIQQLETKGIKRGHGLVAVVCGVESSRIQDDRPLLEQAIKEARKYGAILVATNRDRFIRSRRYDGHNKSDTPTIGEYMQLKRLVGDVPLATIHQPDQPARCDQIKRGQAAKNNRGGRPLKAEHRELLEIVWKKWRTLPY